MPKSPEEIAHLEWLGYVQPVGLVVSIPALLEAQCYVNKNIMGEHARFLGCLAIDVAGNIVPEVRDLPLFVQQALDWRQQDLIAVPKSGPLPGEMASLEVILPQYNETLRPTHVVVDAKPPTNNQERTTNNCILLIQELANGVPLDQPLESDSAKHWNAAPHAKFERLLRESGVPIGLLYNRRQFRLVYAPRGETSGYATFNVDEMAQVAGRPMFAAFQMLLGADRLFNLADNQRLPHILANSRKYQNVVSTALAEQVTSALFELLRGFQAANDQRSGDLLRQVLSNNPQHVYHGLLTVLMRLVFVLYAEDRGLVSGEATYTNHYSVSGLFKRLRSEAGRFPDTMDQRFGAWAQLLTLFRLVYEGGQHGELKIPARKGYLFDPDRYPFLEGRISEPLGASPGFRTNADTKTPETGASAHRLAMEIPRVSDGVVFEVLQSLLILDGERLSYRTLDVEQIGSVYEAIMGFELQVSAGKSIAIKPVKSHGAPATINLEALLAAKPADRAKLLNEWTDQKLGAGDAALLKDANSIDAVVAALEKKIAKHVTPGIVPADSMVFQPSDERRRSGSHYTPRSLTQPIVRTTLEPILKQLITHPSQLPAPSPGSSISEPLGASPGFNISQPQAASPGFKISEPVGASPGFSPVRQPGLAPTGSQQRIELRRAANHTAAIEKGVPHPWQILELKVCDPAMGSGAFLVEACRQLGDELIKAWYAHDMIPADIPPDEDEVLYARRTVAQRCLYGVDKNIMAVDLAKLSLWLVTLAKDHAFTFLDHSLRAGDSLVGLTREQIIGFHWEPKLQKKFGEDQIQRQLDRATEARVKILSAREDVPYRDQEQRMAVADDALNLIRTVGDACVSAFFAGDKKKAREDRCQELYDISSEYLASVKSSTIDFAARELLGQAADSLRHGEHPLSPFHWEIEFPEVFSRENGGFDAFVGNPPFMGGTRISSTNGAAYKDWGIELNSDLTGNADLVAHFFRGVFRMVRNKGALGLIATKTIRQGETRSSSLRYICNTGGVIFSAKRRERWPGEATVVISVVHITKNSVAPCPVLDGWPVKKITAFLFPNGGNENPSTLNANKGLTFKGSEIYGMGFTFDDMGSGDASSIAVMNELVQNDSRNAERIFPYIGGDEVNVSPTHAWDRFVINFGTMALEEAASWPDLLQIVRERVKPQRDALPNNASAKSRKQKWWQWSRPTAELYETIKTLEKVMVCSRHQPNWTLCRIQSDLVYSDALVVFSLDSYGHFSVLQSRVHEEWIRFFGSTLEDRLRYTPTDCFETFPFPNKLLSDELLAAGQDYCERRASLLVAYQEGLTSTYNRFHSPDERDPRILEIRRLHGEMDVAVLRAYGWDDIADQAAKPDFCQFLLDYEEDEDDTASDSISTRQKKKPWRYRWPDEFRDEVLARLLELNEQRHKEELLVGSSKSLEKEKEKKATSATKRKKNTGPSLFGDDD